ncbi:uncharacterized protein LOC122566168 [Bombus pyrosoma]|uniref:uncharacterized protein LOC122566168 n=1 Tax=Bombus pyrosoma TaxID=396416 RepID=UPI001CB95391|nr:uncharacterized protein LOC122566168 [Bombus pyrosoma]
MDDGTAASYIDMDLNFVFQNMYLEEVEIISKRKIKTEVRSSLHIERLLETLKKHNNYDKEETNFILKQFDGTQKATDWISECETECEKLKIQNEEKKIKCLKMYLEKIALEWYQTHVR